jgi:hypothetical protein
MTAKERVLPPPPPLRTGYTPEKRHGKTANEVFTDSE